MYKILKEKNLCVRCGKEKETESVMCNRCKKTKDKYNKKNEKKVKEYQREYQKQRQKRLLQESKCVVCGKPNNNGKYRCDVCSEIVNRQAYENKRYRIQIGICPSCRRNNIFPGEVSCPECKAYQAEKKIQYRMENRNNVNQKSYVSKKILSDKRKADGICIRCGKRSAAIGRFSCDICLAKRRRKYVYAIPKEREEGKCYMCGMPAIKDKKVCEKHYEHMILMTKKSHSKEVIV